MPVYRPYKSGDRKLSAGQLNDQLADLHSLVNLDVAGGSVSREGGIHSIDLPQTPEKIWAMIDTVGEVGTEDRTGHYGWTEMELLDDGTFEVLDGGRTGTVEDDPLEEVSLFDGVDVGTIVRAEEGVAGPGTDAESIKRHWKFTAPGVDGGGGGAAAGDCGFLAEYVNYASLFMTVISKGGMCSCIDLDQEILLTQIGNGEFLSGDTDPYDHVFTSCLETFTVRFVAVGCGEICLELTQTVGGSPGPLTYKLYFAYCIPKEKAVVFSGSGTRYCTGDPALPCGPQDDTFRIKITCPPAVCLCDDIYPVPPVLHATFIGAESCTDCFLTTYPLTQDGPTPDYPQWEYESGFMEGCGPFTGCDPFAGNLGVQISAVNCPRSTIPSPFVMGMYFIGPLTEGNCPTLLIQCTLVEASCNPFVQTFDLSYGSADATALALLDALCPGGRPTQVVLTA